MSIRKTDILDTEIVDAYELAADGYYHYYLTTTLVSTDSLSKEVTINYASDGEGIFYSKDHPAQHGDIVSLSGTTGADGYYTINQVLNDLTFTVNETIPSSIGGGIVFIYPSGASNVGFDSRGLTSTNADTLQDAVKDVAAVVDDLVVNSVSFDDHETLRQLIHFLESGPGPGFATNAYRKILPAASIFPSSVIWYLDAGLTIKLVEQLITWSGAVPTTIIWNMYKSDGVTVKETCTEVFTYGINIFDVFVTRTFS